MNNQLVFIYMFIYFFREDRPTGRYGHIPTSGLEDGSKKSHTNI